MKISPLRNLLPAIIICLYINVSGQCLMTPLSLGERVSNSSLIIEGRVVDQFCIASNHENAIYTINKVEVASIYKGSIDSPYIYIVTEGGDLGYRSQKVMPSLNMHKADEGILLCTTPRAILSHTLPYPVYSAYGEEQGFMRYDAFRHFAYGVFDRYGSIQQVNDSIRLYTHSDPITLHPLDDRILEVDISKLTQTNAVINSLSPMTISAGTNSILTINGSGFGSTRGSGKVSFSFMNGNGSYVDALPVQYVSWSDAQIQVQVPDQSGSGHIVVTTGGGSQILSTDSIFVPYDEEQWIHNDTPYVYVLSNLDTVGGYRWYMNSNMASTSASSGPFARALDEWRCHTGVNWLYNGTTPIDTSGSGINLVRFGKTNELAAGVLGTLHWINESCFDNGHLKTFISNYDMIISPSYTWCYGPQNPLPTEVDIQTIFMHEFGHAHMINHINGPQADFMHSTTANGQAFRTLSTGDQDGATYALTHSIGQTFCGVQSHSYYTCVNGISTTNASTPISVYPNPATDKAIISGTSRNGAMDIYDNTGRIIAKLHTMDQQTEIHISGLADGLYIGKYTLGTETHTFKLCKLSQY